MTLTFYHSPMTTSGVTEAILAELGTPHEVKEISLSAGDTKNPEFLKLNPNGKVPVIVHDGTSIWESAAITMYLGEVFGVEAKLYPEPGPRRGEAMKWITWGNVSLAEGGGRLARALHVKTEDNPEKAAEKARSDIAVCLEVLEGVLQEKQYLLGEYSLADTHLQSILFWITSMDVPLTQFPKVKSWLGQCGDRPAQKQMMEKYMKSMKSSH